MSINVFICVGTSLTNSKVCFVYILSTENDMITIFQYNHTCVVGSPIMRTWGVVLASILSILARVALNWVDMRQ